MQLTQSAGKCVRANHDWFCRVLLLIGWKVARVAKPMTFWHSSENRASLMACLPFTLKNRSVNSCSKWDASNPEWEFSRGCALSISKTFCRKIGLSKAIQAEAGLELVKTSKWNAHFPFGNSVWEFWSTFQEIPFSRENFRLGRQN